MRSTLIAFALATTGLACSSADRSSSSSESGLTEVDKSGDDVQVLQVWTPGRVYPVEAPAPNIQDHDIAIRATECKELGKTTHAASTETEVDCSRALSVSATMDMNHDPAPLMNELHFAITQKSDGSEGPSIDPAWCDYVEARLVLRDGARQGGFRGIGMWTSTGETFQPELMAQVVGRTTLKSGEGASVIRLVGVSTCHARGASTSDMYAAFRFKPYAAFDVGSGTLGTRYKVWENADDHVLGWQGSLGKPDAWVHEIDRQGELLAR